MEQKTTVNSGSNCPELLVTREFDLPVSILFRAFSDPEILQQWMGTQVLNFEGRKHGGYQLETKDTSGKTVFQAHGVFHEFIPERKITRTFEMTGTPFGVQLEFYEFEKLSENTSRLVTHILYESAAQKDQVLKIGFEQGISMAHNRIQEIAGRLK